MWLNLILTYVTCLRLNLPQVELAKVKDALQDESWVEAMKVNFIRYTQVEGVYFDETFVPVACIEFILVLLGHMCFT